jgi:hypothetical protein
LNSVAGLPQLTDRSRSIHGHAYSEDDSQRIRRVNHNTSALYIVSAPN